MFERRDLLFSPLYFSIWKQFQPSAEALETRALFSNEATTQFRFDYLWLKVGTTSYRFGWGELCRAREEAEQTEISPPASPWSRLPLCSLAVREVIQT
jgi:hypothetical protein